MANQDIQEVSEKEYLEAVKNLIEFSALDEKTFQNLEDLSAYASLVGRDIKRIIRSAGTIQKTEFEFQRMRAVSEVMVIRAPLGEEIEILAISEDGMTNVDIYKIEPHEKQVSIYRVSLPANSDIVDERGNLYPRVHAFENFDTKVEVYYPTKHPEDPHHQQGFVRVLKKCIQSLLSVISQKEIQIPKPFRKLTLS